MTFTFFDLVAAMRNITLLKFTAAGSDVQSYVTGVYNASRDSRTWQLQISGEPALRTWEESNTGALVISVV
jgi:hypothetical protein